MSDNASEEEQQQQMQEIFICADVWLGVFAFISPFELGQIMALISDRLDVLVDVHFKSREWALERLLILRENDGNGAEIANRSRELQPIPQEPLPNKLIGFKDLQICYINQTVIEFLQRFRRLFDFSETTVYIGTYEHQNRSWEIIWQKIWPLVNDNICGFVLAADQLDHLRQFSPAILPNCPNLRSIDSWGIFPELPGEDNANASSNQAVAKWLITPRGDGRPKILRCGFYRRGMEGIKRSFVNALEPINFIITFELLSTVVIKPFELKNNWTRERLTLRQMDERNWLLMRCPIGREEDKWTKWEKEAIELGWDNQWNFIDIIFTENSDIGDVILDANEGPSEPNK